MFIFCFVFDVFSPDVRPLCPENVGRIEVTFAFHNMLLNVIGLYCRIL